MTTYAKHFIPLESNPEVFTNLLHNLGGSRSLKFVDVLSLDDEGLSVIPKPVLALILIMSPCPLYDAELKDQKKFLAGAGGKDVIWLKQTIDHACGLYALLHAVCNQDVPGAIKPESELDRLIKTPPSERVSYVERSDKIEEEHMKAARQGSSRVPRAEEPVENLYLSFVKRAGQLYELDGTHDGPVIRGSLGDDDDVLGGDLAVDQVRKYVESSKDGVFGLLALVQE